MWCCPLCLRPMDENSVADLDERYGVQENKALAPYRCQTCLEKARAEIRRLASLKGGNEQPPPANPSTGRVGDPPLRLRPSMKIKKATPGIWTTPPGVLPSQPDGLTFRQRAANKSSQ